MIQRVPLFGLVLLLSCSAPSNIELEGNWAIIKVIYKGEETYPTDLTPNRIRFNVQGYQDYEKFEFSSSESYVIVPGFSSEELILKYGRSGDSLFLFIDEMVFNEYKTKFIQSDIDDILQIRKVENYQREITAIKDSLDSVKTYIIQTRGAEAEHYDLSKEIYCKSYRFSYDPADRLLKLTSNTTEILLIPESYLVGRRIDELLMR